MKKDTRIKAIYYNPSKYCNLKCSHCWVSPEFQQKKKFSEKDLSLKKIEEVFSEIKEMGAQLVKFTGGEPLLRPDILNVFHLCRNLDLSIHLETNGTLIDREITSFFEKAFRETKNTFISISIDGCENTHDKRRGVKGAYTSALKGIDLLSEAAINVQVIMSIARDNIDEIDEVLNFCKFYNIHSMKINYINDIERGEKLFRKGDLLTVTEVIDIENKLSEIRDKYKFNFTSNIPMAFRKIKDMRKGGHCGIFGIAGLLHNGDVSICGVANVSPDIIAGNVNKSSFKDIWANADVFQKLRREVPEKFSGICQLCGLKAYCLGTCRADSWYKNKNFKDSFTFCQQAHNQGLFPKKWCLKK